MPCWLKSEWSGVLWVVAEKARDGGGERESKRGGGGRVFYLAWLGGGGCARAFPGFFASGRRWSNPLPARRHHPRKIPSPQPRAGRGQGVRPNRGRAHLSTNSTGSPYQSRNCRRTILRVPCPSPARRARLERAPPASPSPAATDAPQRPTIPRQGRRPFPGPRLPLLPARRTPQLRPRIASPPPSPLPNPSIDQAPGTRNVSSCAPAPPSSPLASAHLFGARDVPDLRQHLLLAPTFRTVGALAAGRDDGTRNCTLQSQTAGGGIAWNEG